MPNLKNTMRNSKAVATSVRQPPANKVSVPRLWQRLFQSQYKPWGAIISSEKHMETKTTQKDLRIQTQLSGLPKQCDVLDELFEQCNTRNPQAPIYSLQNTVRRSSIRDSGSVLGKYNLAEAKDFFLNIWITNRMSRQQSWNFFP